MKNIIGLLIKATATVALVACAGQSSDPLQDYKDIKPPIPKHDKETPIQEVEVSRFKIAVGGTTEKSYGNFILNKKGTVEIKIVPINGAQIQDADINVLNFPGSNQPQKSKVNANTFALTWTPRANDLERIDFDVSVVAKVQGRVTEQTKDLVFTVSRNEKDPTIERVTGLGIENAQEGKNVQFSVVVKDPNYQGEGKPEIYFPPVAYENTEAFTASAHNLVDCNSKKAAHSGDGVFTFFCVMDLSKLPQDIDRKGKVDPNSPAVTLCLNIRTASVANRLSGAVQECLEDVKYSAQPPTIELLSSERTIKAGQSNSIDLKITTSTKNGKVDLEKVESQIANLAGTKSITCAGLNEVSATCTITWTPSCTAKNNTQKSSLLKLKAVSKLNNSKKETLLSEQFEIQACEAEKK